MRKMFRKRFGIAGVLAGALLVLVASTATAQSVTGQWDFFDPENPHAATVGQDGSIWLRPTTNQEDEVLFGTTTDLGIPDLPDGPSGVMSFPAFDPYNAIALWHGMPANGGGWYVNEYTIIYDLLYPQESNREWRSLWQTNACNYNDGDFFVNPDGGIGIWGVYDGRIRMNNWYRVAFSLSVDVWDPNDPNSLYQVVDKYIDGELVGTQDLDWLDGTHSLYTVGDGIPTYLFADESNDNAPGYVNSFQIRNYGMSEAEVAALGGASAGGIPIGSGVAGSYNFDNPANPWEAAVGNDLEFWNFFEYGCYDPNCPQDLAATTQFGTTTDFAIADMPDGPANVMRFDATIPCTGYLFPHGAEANGDPNAIRVNNYTIIADLYYATDDFDNPPEGHDPSWTTVYQTDENNGQDSMLWIWIPGGMLGDDGYYSGTPGWIQPDTWMRVVAAVQYDPDAVPDPNDPNNWDPNDPNNSIFVTKYVIYDDNTVVGPVRQATGSGDDFLDGKRALRTDDEVGFDALFFFTNDWESPVYTHRGFASSLQVRDYTMPEAEVVELGGPRVPGIPRPPACEGDVDGDGDTDLSDLAALLAAYGSSVGDPNYDPNADFDDDGDVDLSDLAFLLADYGCEG